MLYWLHGTGGGLPGIPRLSGFFDRAMQIVAERAPNGFERLDDVISHDELVAISERYKKTAGFDPATLNNRPSPSATRKSV